MDSDIITSDNTETDFTALVLNAGYNFPYKLSILVFITFIILSTDTFITRVLSKFDGAVDTKYPTSWGVILQATFLTIAVMILDFLITQKII